MNLPTNPVTVDEHRACYQHHRALTIDLKIKIDLGLLNGLDPSRHRALVEEHQDESECAAYHFTMVRMLGLATGADEEAVPR